MEKRVIKFRGKKDDMSNYKWVYGNLLNECSIGKVGHGLESYRYSSVIANTVRQFTGNTDINGIEIYEGDILESNNVDGKQLFLCVFECSSYVYGWNLVCLTGQYSPVHNETWETGVVVGNDVDTPELLKAVEENV